MSGSTAKVIPRTDVLWVKERAPHRGATHLEPDMLDLRLLKAAAVLSFIASPVLAIEIVPIERRFSIGATGLICTTGSCPKMGIVESDNPHRNPMRPLWSSSEMPKLLASQDDADRIAAAWEARGCLVAEGSFYTAAADLDGPPVLQVHSIIGDCR